MEYRMKRVISLALQCTELICLLCMIYANQVKRIASAGSQSCKPLPPVEHGTYTCSENLESVHCELKCLPFYLIPITQIGPNQTRMSLKERGVYRCVDEAGGKVWSPPLIFDCVEARYPTDITFYFAVTVKISSGECNDKDTSIRTKFNNAVTVLINHQRCTNLHCRSVQTSSCDGKNIIADIELIMNFDEDLEYSHIQNWADKELTQKLISLFPDYIVTLNNNTAINCPEGTLLQRDLTCRGCSKGYFLDGSDMQCKPCPAGHYQDLTLQLNCKPCPQGAPRDMNGLQSISDCFHVDSFTKKTNLLSALAVVFSVAFVATVLLIYRSQVNLEPDGKVREFYPEPIRQKIEMLLGKETIIPEVGSEALKTSIATSGDGDHRSPKEETHEQILNMLPEKTRKYDKKFDKNKLVDARMSLAGLAASRLSGAFNPMSAKSRKVNSAETVQSTRPNFEWHPIKTHTDMIRSKVQREEIVDHGQFVEHSEGGCHRERWSASEILRRDLKAVTRNSSAVDKDIELLYSSSSITQRKIYKHSQWKVTGPKD